MRKLYRDYFMSNLYNIFITEIRKNITFVCNIDWMPTPTNH